RRPARRHHNLRTQTGRTYQPVARIGSLDWRLDPGTREGATHHGDDRRAARRATHSDGQTRGGFAATARFAGRTAKLPRSTTGAPVAIANEDRQFDRAHRPRLPG